jgi:prepilin-type N-terminal cleavage/methylation domain-containing protein
MLRAFLPPTRRNPEVREGGRRTGHENRLRPAGILKQHDAGVDPRAVWKGFRDRARAQSGFTLIEVMISALLVTLIAGAVAGGLIADTDFTANQTGKSEAEELAQQDQERLKGLSSEQLNDLSQTYTTKLAGTTYTVKSQAWYLNGTNGQTCTAAGGSNATYFKTVSTVSETTASGATPTLATDESIISPPAGGGILTQVHDQTTAPLSGVTVTATGPETDAATTDQNGCTVFSAIQSGDYTMTEADPGYVDVNGNPSPLSTTTTVTSTGWAWPGNGNPVEMGPGGGITASFSTVAPNSSGTPVTLTGQQANGLSWLGGGGAFAMSNSNSNSVSSATASITTKTATGSSIMGLFPFASLNPTSYTNNYQVWAGTCRQEEPPTGTDAATVTPGSSQSMSVQEPGLNVSVTYNGVAQKPADLKLTFNSSSGSTCTDSYYATVASGTAIPKSGWLAYPGAPYASNSTSATGGEGQLTVCADYNGYYGTANTYNTNFSNATSVAVPITPTSSYHSKC